MAMFDFEEMGDRDILADDSCDEIMKAPTKLFPDQPVRKGWLDGKRPESIDRKMQVLVLHGQQSNESLVAFQVQSLKATLKNDADFHFVEGDKTWSYVPGRDLHDADEMSRMLSKGKDFKYWFDHHTDDAEGRLDLFAQGDPSVKVTYHESDRAVDKLLSYVAERGPVDVVVALFEGCIVVHLAVERLLKQGATVPWRNSIFFGSTPIRDHGCAKAFAKRKSPHPTVHVFGRTDLYYMYGRTGVGMTMLGTAAAPSATGQKSMAGEDYYERPTILEHTGGHSLPSDAGSQAIYERVAEEMRWHCGLQPRAPRRAMVVPKPLAPPLFDFSTMHPRKLRVLCMCGGHSCRNVVEFQSSMLKSTLGNDAEWVYHQGSKPWTWFEGEPIVSETEKALARGQPLFNWYNDTPHLPADATEDTRMNRFKQFDPSVRVEYHDFPGVVDELRQFLRESGPFDVIVAFSQACMLVHMLTASLRREGEPIPWRLSAFFCGMHVRDSNLYDLFEERIAHPTVHVFGKEDEYYEYSRLGFGTAPRVQEQYYDNPMILTHVGGHQFPFDMPQAGDIYRKVVSEIWKWSGGRDLPRV